MDGTKILSMVVENMYFLDSLNFLLMSLKSMPKSFYLTYKKGYYPHFFNTAENLEYVVLYPEAKYYGADYMRGGESSIIGMVRGAKKHFSEIRNSRSTAWTMSIY
jgi:hypothetical protein